MKIELLYIPNGPASNKAERRADLVDNKIASLSVQEYDIKFVRVS